MKEINKKAPIVVTKSIFIEAKPKEIWEKLTGINQWSSWQPDIPFAEIKVPLSEGAKFNWKSGKTAFESRIHTVQPFYFFGWEGKKMGVKAIHNWILKREEDAPETEVVCQESMEGIMAHLLKPFLLKKVESSIQHWLIELKKVCENP